jgi:hypothetical protein
MIGEGFIDIFIMNSNYNEYQSQRNSSFTQSYPDLLKMISDKFYEMQQIQIPKQRRQRQPWADDETKLLLLGVKLFGKGRWALIHQQMGFSNNRTPTDLKDKWRNLIDSKQNSRIPKDLKNLAEIINSEQGTAENAPQIVVLLNDDMSSVPAERENPDDLFSFQFSDYEW